MTMMNRDPAGLIMIIRKFLSLVDFLLLKSWTSVHAMRSCGEFGYWVLAMYLSSIWYSPPVIGTYRSVCSLNRYSLVQSRIKCPSSSHPPYQVSPSSPIYVSHRPYPFTYCIEGLFMASNFGVIGWCSISSGG